MHPESHQLEAGDLRFVVRKETISLQTYFILRNTDLILRLNNIRLYEGL